MFSSSETQSMQCKINSRTDNANRITTIPSVTSGISLLKSINTAIEIYSVTSKRLEFKMYLSKSREVLVSTCT